MSDCKKASRECKVSRSSAAYSRLILKFQWYDNVEAVPIMQNCKN